MLGDILQDTGVSQAVKVHLLELLGTVVDSIHGSHVGQEGLGSADVAGSLLSSNVLLTSLESKTHGLATQTILGNTDQATGKTSLAGLLDGHESGVRATVTQGNTKTLRVTECDVSAPFAGRSEDGQ